MSYLKNELTGFVPTPQATDIIKDTVRGSSILRMAKTERMTSDKRVCAGNSKDERYTKASAYYHG